MNKLILTGNMAKNPYFTGLGRGHAEINVAVGKDFKTKKTNEHGTDFITLVAHGTTAEFSRTYLSKGDLVEIEYQVKNYNGGHYLEVITVNKLGSYEKNIEEYRKSSQAYSKKFNGIVVSG